MRSGYIFCFLLATFIHLAIADGDCADKSASKEVILHKNLLCKYDKDNRPVKDHKTSVNVTMRMLLKLLRYSSQFASVETITLKSWISLKWKDAFLKWDPNDYDGLDETIIHSSKIWIPDLSLYDSPNPSSSAFSYPCLVSHTGDVSCIPLISHTATCKMDYKSWPFDRQNCTLTFGTWMHKGEEVNFVLAKNPLSTFDYTENKIWKLVSTSVSRHSGVYASLPNETYPTLRFSFLIERYTALLVEQYAVPAIAMITMTIVSLCLNLISSERIFLMIFNVACHFFYINSLDYHIPANGNNKPDILIYFRDTSILSCFVLLHGVILRNILKYTTAVPDWINKLTVLMNTAPGKIVFHEFDPSNEGGNAADDVENLTANDSKISANIEWQKVVLFFNRSFFVIVIITYIILILNYVL